jgi:Terminase small subunit
MSTDHRKAPIGDFGAPVPPPPNTEIAYGQFGSVVRRTGRQRLSATRAPHIIEVQCHGRNARPPAAFGPRQERFVEEYLVEVNAKQAAIRARYSPKTAEEARGSRLSSNVTVQRVIAARMAERSQRTEVAADRGAAQDRPC